MISLVATDVDGTLLDHQARLAPDRAAAVRRLTAAGIRVVLATGKTWPSITGLWTELELPGPHVACNGAAVVGADGTIHDLLPLDPAVAGDVAAELAARAIPYACYLDDGTLVTSRLAPELAVLPALGEPTPQLAGVDGRRVLKVLAVITEQEEADLRSLHDGPARIVRTSHRFLEWTDPRADKAHGLGVVTRYLGIGMQEVVAVGDAENDRPMLAAAGMGVAVSGATPAAVDAADLHLCSDLTSLLDELAAAGSRAR